MALTDQRDTRERQTQGGNLAWYEFGMAVVKVHQGGLTVINAAGFATPGAAATTHKPVAGRAKTTVDNTGGSAGDLISELEFGVFLWKNSGSSAIIQADVGLVCFVEDDETVSKTDQASSLSAVGRIMKVTADGVEVLSGPGAI